MITKKNQAYHAASVEIVKSAVDVPVQQAPATSADPAAVRYFVGHAHEVHNILTTQRDLSPRNSVINETLSTFVRSTMRPRPQSEVVAILNTPSLQKIAPHLRGLLGRAEFEMERYCANAMIGNEPKAPKEYSSYRDFIYTDNYVALVKAELDAMKWRRRRPPISPENGHSIAFVGAGPLPISAIMMYEKTKIPVTCIDSDPEAVRLGRQLIRYLAATEPSLTGMDKHMSYVHAKGEEHNYVTHPVIVIASLVPKKDTVLMQMCRSSRTGGTLVVRSAQGLSTLLYQPEETPGGQEFYNTYLVGATKHCPQAINNSLVFKYPPGKWMTRNKPEGDDVAVVTPDVDTMTRRMYRMRTKPDAAPI